MMFVHVLGLLFLTIFVMLLLHSGVDYVIAIDTAVQFVITSGHVYWFLKAFDKMRLRLVYPFLLTPHWLCTSSLHSATICTQACPWSSKTLNTMSSFHFELLL